MGIPRILIVEDEAIVAMDIESRLLLMGYEVAGTAPTGEEALVVAEERRPDLILMDIRLEGMMDGVAAAGRIRDRFRLPVVFLTAYSENSTLERAKGADPFGYILKPFEDRELKTIIEMALYKHRAEEEILRLNRLYAVLSQVNQAIMRARSREDVFDQVCRIIVEFGGFKMAWVGWLDRSTQKVEAVAQFGDEKGYLSLFTAYAGDRPKGRPLTGTAVHEGKPVIVNDFLHDERLRGLYEAGTASGFGAMAAFPISFRGEVAGALTIYAAERELFHEREIRLLEEVALDVSFGLDKLEEEAKRKRAEVALKESEERYRRLFDEATEGVVLADAETGILQDCNQAFLHLTGYEKEDLIGRPQTMLHPPEEGGQSVSRTFELHRSKKQGQLLDARLITRAGAVRDVEIKANVLDFGGRRYLQGFFRDVTEERKVQFEREISLALMRLLNERNNTHELIRLLTRFFQDWTGCEAVGVRLREGDDFPYYETRGFPPEFVEAENRLCVQGPDGNVMRDEAGNPVLECMCGNILSGRFDPALPFFTEKGSFCSNGTTELLARTTEADRQTRTRNRCNSEGYESVALIPLRQGGQVYGLLQLNDRAKGRFTPELIGFLENAGDQIAVALAQRQAQAALQASETRFKAIFDSAGVAIGLADPQSWWIQINRAFERMTGYTAEELCHLSRRLTHPEDVPGLEERRRRVRDGLEDSYRVEKRYLRKDGSTLWMDLSVNAIRGENRELISMVVAGVDITERKQAEEALRSSELKYRRLYESMTDAFAATDMEGHIREFNPAYQAMLGYEDEELRRLTYRDLTPETWHAIEDRIVAEQVLPKGYSGVYEKEYRRRDGTVFPVELKTALIRDDAGRPAGMWAIVRDITERKRAEEAVQQSEGRLRRAQAIGHVGNWEIDLPPRRIWASEEAFRIYGIERTSEFLPLDYVQQRVFPEDRPGMDMALRDLVAGARDYDVQFRIRRVSDGEVRFLHSKAERIVDETGTLVKVAGVIQDLTERKLLEDQLRQAQKMEAVGQLAGGVAHDFNNILAATMMRLGLLQSDPDLTSDTRAALRELEGDVRRAASLTRQLLIFSRRQAMQVKRLDLNEVLSNLLKMLRRLLGEHIDLLFQGGGTSLSVEADAGMMEQVVMNLCVNARDAMPGGGRLTLGTRRLDIDAESAKANPEARPGPFVCLTVTDTGTGMDEATMRHVFEPFFTTKEVGKGTGLGLATVYGIVKQHQGWVEVDSTVGKGSTFRVYLPASAGPATGEESSVTINDVRGGTETILLVEDEATLRRMAALSLKKRGYTVLEAANGVEALKLWAEQQERVDLLLTDMVMPEGVTGLDLAGRLRKDKAALKVIVSSGYSADMATQDVLKERRIRFLPKPYEGATLLKVVRDCLDGREGEPNSTR
jgi:PAS domain S-box-containing protein